ncbi:MAG: alkaline phosphatase, partial [Phycisphaerae bacterium]
IVVGLLFHFVPTAPPTPRVLPAPTNIIFLIGDGMGFEQVKAAGLFLNGQEGTLAFESWPHQAEVSTYSANSEVTDSAASATAMATGHKVNNGVISQAIPGDGRPLETILERFAAMGRGTGLVTTTEITDATPACFAAHTMDRGKNPDIAECYLNQTRPNVLFGGGKTLKVDAAMAAGYTVVTDRAGLEQLDTESVTHVAGLFGEGHMPYEYDYLAKKDLQYDVLPHLSEMACVAMRILDNNPRGFFLMIEGGKIDHAGHGNDLQRNVHETIEFARTAQRVMDQVGGRCDTLVVVTADHETGGLKVIRGNGQGVLPTVTWSTKGHTPVRVPAYAWGLGAHHVSGIMDNTQWFRIGLGLAPLPAPTTMPAVPAGQPDAKVPAVAGAN